MTGRRPGGVRRRRPGRAQRVSLAVQVAVVCTGLVLGLIPLTAPLPAMDGPTVALTAVTGLALSACVAALGLMVLVPAMARVRTSGRVLTGAVVGAAAAVTAFTTTAGLITRPLLLIAGAALVLVAVDTIGPARRS